MTPIGTLHVERIAEAVFIYVFQIAFPAVLLTEPTSGVSNPSNKLNFNCDPKPKLKLLGHSWIPEQNISFGDLIIPNFHNNNVQII